MISINEALRIHEVLIDKFGGTLGVRDLPDLDAALQRPYSTFDSNDLYPSIQKKAAALIESIVKNHPFLDGNKRMGYVLMRLLLLENHYDIEATETQKYQFVMSIATGEYSLRDITEWLHQHVHSLNS